MADEELSFGGAISKAEALDKINSALIFGESGMGKTVFAASAIEIEDYSPVLIVDVEGSTAGVGRIHPDVDVISAPTHAHLEAIKDELLTKQHKYKTVIIDTFNVAQNRAEKFFRAKPENANNKFGVWGDLKDWSINFARDLHHAPFLAILVAHTQTDKDENTGRMLTTVKLAGSSKQDMPAIFDVIGYMDAAENEEGDTISILRVSKTSGIVTKNRFGVEGVIEPAEGKRYPTMVDLQMQIILANPSLEKEEEEEELDLLD